MELDERAARYRTHSGKKDGKIVISGWTDVEGKNIGKSNETFAYDQAKLEIDSKYKKQLETGYMNTESEVDNSTFKSPMLAKNYEDFKDKLFKPGVKVFSQPKLDGIRCVVNKDGMWTRNGKKITSCPHIYLGLASVFTYYKSAVFDGELYADKLSDNFNEIVSIVKKAKPTREDMIKARENIQYHTYDLIHDGMGDTDLFSDRTNTLGFFIRKFEPEGVVLVPTTEVANQAQLDDLYEKYLEEGQEGQIVREDAAYQHKRTNFLLKRKEFQDAEYIIEGIFEGEGNRKGTVGWMTFKNAAGESFKSNVKGSHEYLAKLLAKGNALVGKTATIKYFNLTPNGIPRFPYVIAIDRESYE
jgi:DNA ligase-1